MSFEKYNISLLYKKWIKTTKRRLYEIEKHRRKKKINLHLNGCSVDFSYGEMKF
jgi:hypothetical protein